MIIFGRLTNIIFQTDDKLYTIYGMTVFGGKRIVVEYSGENFPPVRKTVQYQITGDWVNHPKYGKQFKAHSIERSDIKTTKVTKDYLNNSHFGSI